VNRDLRRTPAFILALPTLVVTALFLRQATAPDTYGIAWLAQAASAVGIIAPVCAALAAWEGSRLRRGGALRLAPSRSEWQIGVRALLPVALLGVVAIAGATLLLLAHGPRLVLSDFRVLTVPLAVVGGHSALAYAAGRRLPAVFVVPGALVLSWFVVAYSIAIEPLWVRHLTGTLIDCCDVATVPARGALIAPIVIGVAACLAAAVVLTGAPALARAGVAGGVLALAIGFGTTLVSDLGSEPTEPRRADDLRCSGDAPRVCIFPEDEAAAPLVRRRAQIVYERLTAAGVRVPDVVSEARPRSAADWSIGVVPGTTADAVDATLVYGLLPSYPSCAHGDAPYPGFEAYRPVAMWLARTAGVTTGAIDSAAEPRDHRELDVVRQLPHHAQLAWYRANVGAIAACGVAPTLHATR
jgi:hypothetical protein